MADLLTTAFQGLISRIQALEANHTAFAYNTQLLNGGLETWTAGPGPFTANGATCADHWTLSVGSTSIMSVTKDTAHYDIIASATCAKIVVSVSDATPNDIDQALVGPFIGTMLGMSARIMTSVAGAVKIGINGNVVSAFHSGSGVYETLAIAGTPVRSPILARILIYKPCTVYVDSVMLVQGAAPVDYVYHPLQG